MAPGICRHARGREPQYEDMPQRIRNMEQTMLHIGFKLSNLE